MRMNPTQQDLTTWTGGELYGRFLDKAGCTYALKPDHKDFPYNGGTVVVGVTASFVGCGAPEIPPHGYDWVHVTGPTWNGAKGTGTVRVAAGKSTTSVRRPSPDPSVPGIITMGGEPFLISQAGKPCSVVRLTPASQAVPKAGVSNTFAVQVDPSDCGWGASSVASWLTIDGLVAGAVNYTAAENGGATSRTGSIVVSITDEPARKKAFTVRQAK
jgi:hypothetical protein